MEISPLTSMDHHLSMQKLTITDMNGTKVYAKILSVATGLENFQTSMDAGIYFIEVVDATQTWNSRLVIK